MGENIFLGTGRGYNWDCLHFSVFCGVSVGLGGCYGPFSKERCGHRPGKDVNDQVLSQSMSGCSDSILHRLLKRNPSASTSVVTKFSSSTLYQSFKLKVLTFSNPSVLTVLIAEKNSSE